MCLITSHESHKSDLYKITVRADSRIGLPTIVIFEIADCDGSSMGIALTKSEAILMCKKILDWL